MSAPIEPSDVNAISRSLQVVVEFGGVFEIRMPHTSRATVSGYFDNPDKAARALLPYDGKYTIYTTLNPVNAALLARASNRLIDYAKHTTSDADILCRRWLPFDFDSVRPSGISATNQEKAAALERACAAREFLTKVHGWPDPIYSDSGNGGHLLYRIDLPNDPEAGQLVKLCIRAVSLLFTDPFVSVDESVHNAARIWKVYSTVACKGDNVVDRPHRRTSILEMPEAPAVVTLEQIKRLAATLSLPEEAKATSKTRSKCSELPSDVEQKLAEWGVKVLRSKPWEKGTAYILDECVFNPDHQAGSAAVLQLADGRLMYRCFHDSCREKTWHDVRSRYEPDYQSSQQNDREKNEDSGGTVSEKLVSLAEDVCFFHSERSEAYARITVADHAETHPVRSSAFKDWISHAYYTSYGKPPGSQALQDAMRIFEARARFDGEECSIGLRCARHESDGSIYIDMVDRHWRAIRVTAEGWHIVTDPPALFRRHITQAALCEPDPGSTPADIELLRKFINVRSEAAWRQLVVWLVAAWIPEIAHPVLVVFGEQGTAKSTLMLLLSRLIDPSHTPLRTEPKDEPAWMQSADHTWLITLDNVSVLPNWLSDSVCRAVTGGGTIKRQLYTDADDVVMAFRRVVAMTCIEVVTRRGDVLDRSILLALEPITPENRRSEKQVLAEFERVRPRLTGALLGILSGVLRELPRVEEESAGAAQLPRMADFANVGTAIERVLEWPTGSFMLAYREGISDQNEEALASAIIYAPLLEFIKSGWTGTAQELLDGINGIALEKLTRMSEWPKNAKSLSGQLRRVAPNLRATGIDVVFGSRGRHRSITITRQTPDSCVACVDSVDAEGQEHESDHSADARDANNALFPPLSDDEDEGYLDAIRQ